MALCQRLDDRRSLERDHKVLQCDGGRRSPPARFREVERKHRPNEVVATVDPVDPTNEPALPETEVTQEFRRLPSWTATVRWVAEPWPAPVRRTGARPRIASSALEGGNDESPNTMADRRSAWPPRSSAAAAASGPASSSDPGAKVGGKPGPIAITVADSQFPDKPSNLPLAEFKRQVETLSGGSMTVTILTNASPDGDPPGSDAPIIDKVRSGTFQMAVVPARAWSAAGVTSLKALQAPFLFESDEHVAAIVDDAAITKDLFSGFEGSGVTGLTLFPESLRHLFSFGEPMLTPADVKGRTIRAISLAGDHGDDRSPRRHGRRPGRRRATRRASTRDDPRYRQRLHARRCGSHQPPATATGNVALYAKVMTLVINSAFWTGLDDAQRAIITDGVGRHPGVGDRQPGDRRRGRRRVLRRRRHRRPDRRRRRSTRSAPPRHPVYAALEADPATKRAIAAIRARAAGTSPRRRGCEPVIDAATWCPMAATCRTGSTGSSTPTRISRAGV